MRVVAIRKTDKSKKILALRNFANSPKIVIRFPTVRLKSGNACYHSVQNLLSSRLLSQNFKVKVHRIIILPVEFMGVKLRR
jgi:hypothetical protein